MKLFWKIFFTTMLVSAACLALGGYLLISSGMDALLERERQQAYDYGDMVYYSIAGQLNTSVYPLLPANDGDAISEIGRVASALSISIMDQAVPFAILSPDGDVVFSSLGSDLDKDLLASLDDGQRGWTLKETQAGFYIQAMRPALYQGSAFYIETIGDATYIFKSQRTQYETLLKIMMGAILTAGLFTLILSRLLTRRIVRLSRVTRDISQGDLSKRADPRGGDEIAALSRSFNLMAGQLEQKIHDLKDESSRKELFVGAFSHELKTPLTSIIGYSDMLRRKEMSGEQLQLCAQNIFSEGKRLEHLSMRLMDLIVLKNQQLDLHPAAIDVLLDEICTDFAPRLMQSGIVLRWDVEPADIPMERDLMKTVFINLIDNGQKAIETGGQLVVTGKRRRQGGYDLCVRDTGKGMAQEELSKIKNAFYMVDKSRSRRQGGVGLGLAICDEILRLHGFDIAFQSTVGVGTAVTVTMKGEQK